MTGMTLRRVVPVRSGRPFGLVALIGLLLLKAVLLGLGLVRDDLPDAGPLRRIIALPGALSDALRDTPIVGAVVLVLVALLVVAALGLWGRRRWGWVIAMVVTGLFLATDIWAFSDGRANHLWMLLNVITVLYLNQREVRESLGRREAGAGRAEAMG
jgi:uncharacterized membrane protein (DUF2068 family)